ncbi:hypothetical protein ACFY0R_10195 [Streptomyces sp. NPDC001633]|uniref:hypothetical protein n=1 Tax=Streptomyces sp. NPDC001633 TaxID=3364595 RepID=UPI003684C40D
MLEPEDLQDFTSAGAMNSVLVEVQHQRVVPGRDGLFTATRHISLISALITRFSGDAQYLSEHAVDRTVHALTAACRPLAAAQLHYAYALNVLVMLHATSTDTQEREGELYRHLDGAVKSLDDARVALFQSPNDTPPPSRGPAAAPAQAACTSTHRKR